MTNNTQTKSETAYRRIRTMIIEREILAGERWSIRDVARRLNMSVIPVTEAVRRLETERLIVTQARSGARLRDFTKSERIGILLVREALEVQAARIVTKRHAKAPAKAQHLRDMAQQLKTCLQSGEEGKAALLDYELHLHLVRWAGSSILTDAYTRIAFLSKIKTGGWKGLWARHEMSRPSSHAELVEGVLSGDELQAEEAVRRHIRRNSGSIMLP